MPRPELGSRYLGLELRTPIVASSSPLTGNVDDLLRLEEAGAAAVVLPSLFEEQLTRDSLELDRMLATGTGTFAEAFDYLPGMPRYDTGPDRYLELVAAAKDALQIPVIASLNGSTPGGWVEHAHAIEEAGADALELNVYLVAADPDEDAASVESRIVELVRQVRAAIGLPLAVKLSPYFTAFASFARRVVAAGADGLVLFNRFYQPDLDLETLQVTPRLALSTREELRLPLRWIAVLHGRLGASLAATSGVHESEDVAKALLVGADVVTLASALLEHGPSHLGRLEQGLREWLVAREYESVAQLKGSLSQRAVADPDAYERANYMRTLRSYASRFHA